MSSEELVEAVRFELAAMRITVQELGAIRREVEEVGEPSIRDRTAAGAFLAQFYMGAEKILKRIHQHVAGPVPGGASWHVELFKRFCEPGRPPLPVLIDRALEADLKPFRRFRHVVHHGYGFQLQWDRMRDGVLIVESVFHRFEESVEQYLQHLP